MPKTVMNILRRLALAIALMHLAPAVAQAPRKATAPAALQSEFDAFIATFRAALKANDAAAVTAMTKHPFETGDYPDAAQFL